MNTLVKNTLVKPLLSAALLAVGHAASAQGFQQTNLVTNNQAASPAQLTDPNLNGPANIAFNPAAGAFWLSDTVSGRNTLYNGDVNGKALTINPLVISIPSTTGLANGTPTGIVFNNSGGGFLVPNSTGGSASATFITSSLDGTLSGWKVGDGAQARLTDFNIGASYTGLAIAGKGTAANLYAADFSQNRINVFDSTFASVSTLAPNAFTDPNQTGFSPFGIQTLGGNLFVTYAQQNGANGGGFVDKYDPSGTFLGRVASGGSLNTPRGLAVAPAGFGQFGGDLLVSNSGSGQISAFDSTGAFQGFLSDASGNALITPGIAGISFGNGISAGDANSLYFTASTGGGADSLFGKISAPAAVPEASTTISFGALLALSGLVLVIRRKKVTA